MWLVLALFFTMAWIFGFFVLHVPTVHVLAVIAVLSVIAHFTLGHHHPSHSHPAFDDTSGPWHSPR
jgi:hypothetical protein